MNGTDTRLAPDAVGKLLLTEAETSQMLSISPRTLFALRKAGKISASKIGSRVNYHINEVRRFAAGSVGESVKV